MGGDDDMVKEAVYLGRTMEWSEHGLGVRPDRRHVRSLLCELVMENCRSISLAQDRLDLGVAAVELAKTMAIPRDGDDERLKRVARYSPSSS